MRREVRNTGNLPLYGEAGDTRLVSQDIAADLLDDGLGRGVGAQLLSLILVVDIIANAHELATIVGAGQQDDGDAHDLGIGNALGVRSIGLEDELINTNGDRADQQGVELLVILVGGGRADIGQLPLEVWSRRETVSIISRD